MAKEQFQEEPSPPQVYAWYVVGVLTFVYIFSFIDRQILNLLVRPIRRDLGITDFQMSLLNGIQLRAFLHLLRHPTWPARRFEEPPHYHRCGLRGLERDDCGMRARQELRADAAAARWGGRRRSGAVTLGLLN